MKKKENPQVYGYIRVSTEDQDQSGLGLLDQERRIRDYCQLYDLDLIEIYRDTASGKNINREGLEMALKGLKLGFGRGMVISKLDRLTRSVSDLGRLIEEYFQKYDLIVVQEHVDTRTAGGRLVLNLLVSVAQWERETISERTKSALRMKRSQGKKTGGSVPFGYFLGADGETLFPDPNDQAVIEKMKRLRKRGHGYYTVAKKLNKRGFRTKQGKLFNQSVVCKILGRT
jgi:DNA invertase Pin-like site-specific DNA recombinase